MTDVTAAARRILLLQGVETWIKKTSFAAALVGPALDGLAKVMFPTTAAAAGTPGTIALGACACFAVAWVWRQLDGSYRKLSRYEDARVFVQTLKLMMDESGLSQAQRNLVWKDLFARYSREAPNMNGRPLPDPAEVIKVALQPPEGTS